ncbi:MAG TPA: hypothetical protein VGO21_02830 [Candidatus Paceibacterota bacterium]|nr:hypothetical protein [Candidatus Paceibacterota bacterium]
MGQFEIQHNGRQYTITEESYVTDDKPPYTDVNITAITEDGCIWRLNPLMNLKGSSSSDFVEDTFYRNLLHPHFMEELKKGLSVFLKEADRLP